MGQASEGEYVHTHVADGVVEYRNARQETDDADLAKRPQRIQSNGASASRRIRAFFPEIAACMAGWLSSGRCDLCRIVDDRCALQRR